MTGAPTAIDLFCGAGGLSTGLEWAGFDILWAVDSDQDIEATYEANHDSELTIGDIEELTVDDIPGTVDEVDLVAGGPPCPTFSTIGRSKIDSLDGRTVITDDRHYLFEDFLRLVNELQPVAFIMENVVDMQSAPGSVRESIIEEIKRQGDEAGYRVDVYQLDAADFGVPQHRERIFFVGNRLDRPNPQLNEWATHREPVREVETELGVRQEPSAFGASPQTTLTKFESGEHRHSEESTEPWVTVGDAILDLPPVSPDGESPPKTAETYTIPPVTAYQSWARNQEDAEDWTDVALANHTARGHNQLDLTIYKLLGEGAGWNIDEISQELHPYRDDIFADKYKKQHPRKPASTIIAHLEKDGHMFIHPREARSLTVREAARLQSFRDTYQFEGPMSTNFRMVGNAVPPLLAEAIGISVRETLISG